MTPNSGFVPVAVPLSRRAVAGGLTASLALGWAGRRAEAAAPTGYDVVLLVGQSNMEGYNSGTPDSAADAAASPLIWQLDANGNIIPAVDPLVQDVTGMGAGMGLTFGKAYAATLPPGRAVLLVGAAYGGTGFTGGLWQAPGGTLATTAVKRANAAMTAAGAGARFAGILWHQGEADIIAEDSSSYAANLTNLIAFFRASIAGAGNATPFVVGEMTYQWIVDNINGNAAWAAQQNTILQVFHTLPDTVPYTAWVSSFGLLSDPVTQDIHFGALAQRQLGRRYADKFFEAAHNLPQPDVSVKSWAGYFVDDGRSFPAGIAEPVDRSCGVTGTVNIVTDPARGNVARISGAGGYITAGVLGSLFNGSYTKMAWFNPGLPGYYNNLISADNPGQAHYLAGVTSSGRVTIAAGHSDGNSTPLFGFATVPAASGTWIHVAAVYDAGARTMTLYCNGTSIQTTTGVGPAPSIGGVVPLTFGAFGAQGAGLDGQLGGGRAWATALTPAQIAAIHGYESTARAGF